jgi:UDP-glucuronate decarboxylase
VRFMDQRRRASSAPSTSATRRIHHAELAERVLALVGGQSRLVMRPLPQDDPRQRQPDITLARQLLDWEPRVPLEQGLERTVAHFRKVLAS